jgi:long-chain acyl-CoA synthetase
LSTVLESHPPSAIVVDAEFLPLLLELICDTSEQGHHTVIVVGELGSGRSYTKQARLVNLVKFADLEREGAKNAQDHSSSEIGKIYYIYSWTPLIV